jgi:hypothetical protein
MDDLRALIYLMNTILSNSSFKMQKYDCFSLKQMQLSEQRSNIMQTQKEKLNITC